MDKMMDDMNRILQTGQNQLIGKVQKLAEDPKAIHIGFRADVQAMRSEVKAEEKAGLVEEVKEQSKASSVRITAARMNPCEASASVRKGNIEEMKEQGKESDKLMEWRVT